MQMTILGCSGGIGGERHTTCLRVDDDILIDVGTGAMRMTLEEMARIRHVFITHAHLDHIMALPAMLDSVGTERPEPLWVHALPEVIEILKAHIFNWLIWPDFSRVPSPEHPFMRYSPLAVGLPVALGEREIVAMPARHGVPAVGYLVRGERKSLVFSGDTGSHDELIDLVNADSQISHLLIEASFDNERQSIAEVSNHYCPATLLPDLRRLRAGVSVWITHLKPGDEAGIMNELAEVELASGTPVALTPDQVIEL